jgi:hypothetical protein
MMVALVPGVEGAGWPFDMTGTRLAVILCKLEMNCFQRLSRAELEVLVKGANRDFSTTTSGRDSGEQGPKE